MLPRIAIPMPHASDRDYAESAIPQYEHAVELAGAEPVRVPLDQTPAQVMKIIERCDGVLLPGSKADIDPAKFGAVRSPRTAASDPGRDAVDELLLQDAYNMRKPILGICYGLQSLNVYRTGSLVQHIPDFLPQHLRTRVKHEAGKNVAVAHQVEVEAESRLAEILSGDRRGLGDQAGLRSDSPAPSAVGSLADAAKRGQNRDPGLSPQSVPTSEQAPAGRRSSLIIPVNSSNHQSANVIGDGLRVVARCPDDGIVEALEGISSDHLVLAVQWHPERSPEDDASRALFSSLIEAAAERHRPTGGGI